MPKNRRSLSEKEKLEYIREQAVAIRERVGPAVVFLGLLYLLYLFMWN